MKMLTIAEAATIADILDGVGEYDIAELLDDYVEATATNNLRKQAGLWERIKGRAKTIMIREYRELVQKARATQSSLEDHMDEMNSQYKDLSKDLKNYRLNDWQYKVRQLNRKVDDINKIMSDFDKSYGRFLQYVVGIRERDPVKSDTSSGDEPSSKLPGVKEREEKESVEEQLQGISEWKSMSRRNNWAQQNTETGEVRISRSKFSQLRKHLFKDKDGYIRLNRKAKGKLPSFAEVLGDDAWEYSKYDEDFIYFSPAGSPSKEEKPAEEKRDMSSEPKGLDIEPTLPTAEEEPVIEDAGPPEDEEPVIEEAGPPEDEEPVIEDAGPPEDDKPTSLPYEPLEIEDLEFLRPGRMFAKNKKTDRVVQIWPKMMETKPDLYEPIQPQSMRADDIPNEVIPRAASLRNSRMKKILLLARK